ASLLRHRHLRRPEWQSHLAGSLGWRRRALEDRGRGSHDRKHSNQLRHPNHTPGIRKPQAMEGMTRDKSHSNEDDDDIPPSGEAGLVHGRVVDEHGNPLPDALVAVQSTTAGAPDIAQRTTTDGSFSLGELPRGLYTLKAHHVSGTGSASVHVTG